MVVVLPEMGRKDAIYIFLYGLKPHLKVFVKFLYLSTLMYPIINEVIILVLKLEENVAYGIQTSS